MLQTLKEIKNLMILRGTVIVAKFIIATLNDALEDFHEMEAGTDAGKDLEFLQIVDESNRGMASIQT